MYGSTNDKTRKNNKFRPKFKASSGSRKRFDKSFKKQFPSPNFQKPQKIARKEFSSKQEKEPANEQDTARLKDIKTRIHDTFLEGIDDLKQMGLEEKIAEFLDRIPGSQTDFFNLSKNLMDRSLIKTSEDLKRALARLNDIGVIETNGDIIRIGKLFK